MQTVCTDLVEERCIILSAPALPKSFHHVVMRKSDRTTTDYRPTAHGAVLMRRLVNPATNPNSLLSDKTVCGGQYVRTPLQGRTSH
jgi:hypothetical protein